MKDQKKEYVFSFILNTYLWLAVIYLIIAILVVKIEAIKISILIISTGAVVLATIKIFFIEKERGKLWKFISSIIGLFLFISAVLFIIFETTIFMWLFIAAALSFCIYRVIDYVYKKKNESQE